MCTNAIKDTATTFVKWAATTLQTQSFLSAVDRFTSQLTISVMGQEALCLHGRWLARRSAQFSLKCCSRLFYKCCSGVLFCIHINRKFVLCILYFRHKQKNIFSIWKISKSWKKSQLIKRFKLIFAFWENIYNSWMFKSTCNIVLTILKLLKLIIFFFRKVVVTLNAKGAWPYRAMAQKRYYIEHQELLKILCLYKQWKNMQSFPFLYNS